MNFKVSGTPCWSFVCLRVSISPSWTFVGPVAMGRIHSTCLRCHHLLAAAGQPVAKHGNYGVSSACGSSNLLEYFGYKFTNNVDELKRSLDRANICFMHAPLFHPAMKNVAPIRKELGVKTFFNMLGPMVNPSFPKRQLVGVFSLELARQYGYLYQNTDKDFVILHSLDGYDEVSLTGPFKFFYNAGERIMEPSEIGLPKLKYADIRGGETVEESAKI